MNPDLSHYSFSTPEERINTFAEIIQSHTPQENVSFNIIDIGCGSGQQSLQLSQIYPNARIQAYDISLQNIKQANDQIKGMSEADRIQFICSDYLKSTPPRAELIVSDSCLHLIPCEDELLCRKLKCDLAPNGRIIFSIPYECLYNQIIFLLRRLFMKAHSRTLENLMLFVACIFYGHKYNISFFRERLPYLYVLPTRIDNSHFRETMRAHGLNLMHEQAETFVLGKPCQRFLVFEHSYV
jgi:trans-aconitate methyltransferase